MTRALGAGAALFALSGVAVVAQTPTPLLPPPIPANWILPRPAPTAALPAWTAAEGRKTVSLGVDGVTLRGYEYAPGTSNAPTLLFFGDAGWTIEAADEIYRAVAERGARVVAYDYRGYGFSEGRADVRNFRRDALRLYDAVAAGSGSPRVAVLGFSVGSAFAAYVASERKVAGVVLIAPISRAMPFFLAHVADFPGQRKDKLMTTQDADEAFDEADMIAKSSAPLLVVHGDADEFVPYAEGKEVYDASPSSFKTFVTLHGVKHNDSAVAPELLAALGHFFTSLR